MEYKINEIFYSLQGEGARAGTANVFIRFADCDLACTFCDTEFQSYTKMTAFQIASKVVKLASVDGPLYVILTGGEPSLQYDEELRAALISVEVSLIAIETNGGTKLKGSVDFISCSPKVAEHVVASNFPEGIDELRYVRNIGQGIPDPKVNATHLFLSPQANGNKISMESLNHCISLVKSNPNWRLSVQQHKLWRVR